MANARTEYISETCPECQWDRDREHLFREIGKGSPVPKGWRVARRARGSWKTISRATRWTTLCGCDT